MPDAVTMPENEKLEPVDVVALAAPVSPVRSAVSAPDDSSRRIQAHDFRRPTFLAEPELRRLRAAHEEFIRYLSARLALHLRMEFGLQLAEFTTQPFEKFRE